MQTTFQIHDMTSARRSFLGERPTFEEAEFFGRWHAARRGIRVTIDRIEQNARRRTSEEMAIISRDALGRLWTDLTWLGGELV